jgi:hypothetical protein
MRQPKEATFRSRLFCLEEKLGHESSTQKLANFLFPKRRDISIGIFDRYDLSKTSLTRQKPRPEDI